MIIFFISSELSTLIGCLKVRLSIRFIIKMFWRSSVNGCDEDQTCGRMPHGSFIRTTRYLRGEKQHSIERTPQLDFFLFPKVNSALKETRFESVDAVNSEATEPQHTIRHSGYGKTNCRAWLKTLCDSRGESACQCLILLFVIEVSKNINPVSSQPHLYVVSAAPGTENSAVCQSCNSRDVSLVTINPVQNIGEKIKQYRY